MSDELITMVKDGVKIRVHPLSVPNHLQLGWVKLDVPEPAAPVAEPEPKPEPVPAPVAEDEPELAQKNKRGRKL